jgi:hypothetical protein
MVLMKHAVHGNEHVSEAEVEARKAAGWVQWPRSLSEKQGSDYLPHSALAEIPKRKPGRPKKA